MVAQNTVHSKHEHRKSFLIALSHRHGALIAPDLARDHAACMTASASMNHVSLRHYFSRVSRIVGRRSRIAGPAKRAPAKAEVQSERAERAEGWLGKIFRGN
jgi:hypothetical protein